MPGIKFLPSFVALLLFLLVGLSGCHQVKTEAPHQLTNDTTLVAPESSLRVPIRYPVHRLQDWINRKITGTFVDKKFALDNHDSLHLKIRKNANIQLSWKGGVLYYTLPLHISCDYTKIFGGLSLKTPEPVTTDLVVRMASRVKVDPQWQIISHSELLKVVWQKEPVIKLGPFQINLRKPLEEYLASNKGDLMQQMDAAAKENIHLKHLVSRLWFDLQKPLAVHKPKPNVWLQFQCHEIKGHLLRNVEDTLVLDLNVSAKTVAYLEPDSMPGYTDLPAFQEKENELDTFRLAIFGEVSFAKANTLLNEKLVGTKLKKEGYGVTIKHVQLYGSPGGLVVALKVKGDIDGTLYLTGKPYFDPKKQSLGVSDFHFDVQTENALVKTSTDLLQEYLLHYMQQYLELNLSDQIDQLPSRIVQAIEKGKSGDALQLHFTHLSIANWTPLVTREGLQFVLYAHGKAHLELQHLKAKKKVAIQN